MGPLANVVRRAGTFHFRRVIPTAAREALGRRELVRTLNTGDPRIARPRAAQLYLLSERIFETAGRGAMLDKAKLARLVQDFYATILDQENRARLGPRVLHPEAREKRHAYFSDLAARTRDALACNRLGDAAVVTEGMLRKQNIAPSTLDASELAQARQAILRAGVDVAEALKARYEGDFNHEPRDKLLSLKLDEIDARVRRSEASQSTTPSASESAPAAPPTQASQLMSEAGATFREAQVATSGWDKQTAHQAGATFRLFVEICGDHPLGVYTRKDAGRFKEAVERLPADYGKAPRYRGRSAAEIAETYAALPAGERAAPITQKTVRRHFSALSTLWASALAKDEVSENILSGFRFANAKRANQQRAMWEQEELRRLFTSPVWAGCASKGRRSAPGDLVIKDERFWLPLVAVFSGLRLEEICQLHMEDIRTGESVIYFDINARPPRKLKNETAVRQVPVHSALKQLGFLGYIEQHRRADEQRLFPDLEPGGADDRLGTGFGKWFTRYRQQIGIYEPGLDFHSFRHTATTLMHQAGVERAVIDHVTGHATPGETTRYTKRSTLAQLAVAIERIDIGIDLASLCS